MPITGNGGGKIQNGIMSIIAHGTKRISKEREPVVASDTGMRERPYASHCGTRRAVDVQFAVRRLLCHRCNLLLSGIESPRFHEKASAYLIHHENNPTGILYRLQRPHKKEIKKPK